jgi:nicotinamidase-related amidase
MKIPNSNRNKALLVIDMQQAFLDKRTAYIVENISNLLDTVPYQTYVVAVFHAEEDSLWDIQQNWTCPKNVDTKTVVNLETKLNKLSPILIEKETRSAFKGNVDISTLLRERGVTEVQIVGTQTNDCILATALDAFDLGFIPYVIEECCEGPTKEFHEAGLKLLRRQRMTNNSCAEDFPYISV